MLYSASCPCNVEFVVLTKTVFPLMLLIYNKHTQHVHKTALRTYVNVKHAQAGTLVDAAPTVSMVWLRASLKYRNASFT